MGLFDKKFCDVCGEKIGMLGNRKLDDGNLCKDCAKKLSPWFEERRHSTVDSIKEQLAYREANKEKVRAFQITREFATSNYHVFIDDQKRQFAIAARMNVETNPDILDLSQIVSCRMEVEQDRDEEKYRDNEGNMKSYNPPRYKYEYDYWMKITVNSPWFDDMDFKMNSFSIEERERGKIMEMENLGNQITAALTGMGYSPQGGMMNNGMYGQQSMHSSMYGQQGMQGGGMYGQQNMQGSGMYGQQGMQGGMYGQHGVQNNGMYGQQGMHGGMYGQQGMQGNGMYGQQGMQGNGMYGQQGIQNNDMYGQQGMQGNGMYGQQGMQGNGMYGQQNMQGGMYDQQSMQGNGMYSQQGNGDGAWVCPGCGSTNTTKFCQQCGQPRPF